MSQVASCADVFAVQGQVIDRFSGDLDLTYDIRALAPDLLLDGDPIPRSSSQEKKLSSAVRKRLPDWIAQTVQPVLQSAINVAGLQTTLRMAG